MVVQWLAGIAAAYWISPLTWQGTQSSTHLHVYAAIYLGGLITFLPVGMALTKPGRPANKFVIGVSQMLMSSLLIHFTGGRIETHFHVFASLVFLSFYRDWRVLIPATIVVAADHYLRGVYWPQSVFGVLTASHWRWMEHAAWVLFEDVFLISSCLRSKREMWSIAERTAALHDSEARYRGIVERADGIFVLEAGSKRMLECNAAFHTLFGYDAAEITGLTLYDFDVAPKGEIDAAIRRVAEDRAIEMERQFRHRDGSLLDVRVTISALAGGRDTVCATVRDITEHRRAEEALRRSEDQLRQANKMDAVGQLAGGIAHDFNNLLTAILGYAEVLGDSVKHDRTLAHQVGEISRAGETAASLTRQLLAFSRRQVLQPKVLDLNAVLANVDKMLRRLIGEHIDLAVAFGERVCPVRADAGQLEQVVVNLVVNARDAMRQGGRISIATSTMQLTANNRHGLPAGPAVVLSVTDTGCGMDEGTRTRIFEPFFTTKEPGKGTGLGLSTVYGIVTQTGGVIDVESAVGKGTTFRIILPGLGEAALAEMPTQAPVAARARGKETVLLVEDEQGVRSLAKLALEHAGYTVLAAASPEEAIRLATDHIGRIDLILTDVIMPLMNGRELAEWLLARHKGARVLFMSGYTDDTLIPHGVAVGELAFLNKPFTPTVLVQRVREVIDAAPVGVGSAA